ncbi:hypothetical protein [Marinobacter caseinilyticus]|uniref:hypothetical protein n=1 Tax=Marinobacter caseinilyticus TaxID=2692195 RepID=UPI00140AB1E5|nr:hypothetical protein [Marinobacter caseinilyticus]
MARITGFLKLGIVMCLLGVIPVASAQSEVTSAEEVQVPEGNVLSDGKLSPEELETYALIARKQLIELTETAAEEVGDELSASGVVVPAAWMLLNDGTIKRVRLGSDGEKAASTIQILMYRAAMKSLARHGKISGTAIVYAGSAEGGSETKLLVIEHEHRLGVSGLKLIPFRFSEGAVTYGAPQSQPKPFELFYDQRSDQLETAKQ